MELSVDNYIAVLDRSGGILFLPVVSIKPLILSEIKISNPSTSLFCGKGENLEEGLDICCRAHLVLRHYKTYIMFVSWPDKIPMITTQQRDTAVAYLCPKSWALKLALLSQQGKGPLVAKHIILSWLAQNNPDRSVYHHHHHPPDSAQTSLESGSACSVCGWERRRR